MIEVMRISQRSGIGSAGVPITLFSNTPARYRVIRPNGLGDHEVVFIPPSLEAMTR